MNKYRHACRILFIAMMIILSGCGSALVSSTVESFEANSGNSSSISEYSESEGTRPVHNASVEPTPYIEATPLPSQEPSPTESRTPVLGIIVPSSGPASAANSTPVLPVTPVPSSEPGTDASPTPIIFVTPIPSSESASIVSPAPVLTVTPIPPYEAVSVASPTPVPAETKPEFIYPIKSFDDETRICLTFDDGGNQKAVKKALEVLKKHDVKATFFVVGKYLKTHEALWKQAVEEGHLICNHTQNHVYLTQLKDDGARKEILDWESVAAEIFGQEYVDKMKQEFPFIRLPGGSGNDSKRILRIVSELGYVPVGWNIETYYAVLRHHDLKTEPVDPIAGEVFAHVSKKVKGGSIVLLHFNPYDTARLDDIITALKDKGLTMHLLTECLEY